MFQFRAFPCPSALTYHDRLVTLGLRERIVLLALVCAKDFTVPAPVLVERVWHGEPMYAPADTLRTHIYHIRKAIAGVAGQGTGRGLVKTVHVRGGAAYSLAMDADHVDVRKWELDLAVARERLMWEPGRETEAGLAAVVGAWSSAPFEDAGEWEFARTERQRLADLHRDAVVELADFRMGMRRYREVIPDLKTLADRYPGDFGVWERLIVALWRGGQDLAAAQACRDCTDTMNRLGLDTSEVYRLHEAILNGQLSR